MPGWGERLGREGRSRGSLRGGTGRGTNPDGGHPHLASPSLLSLLGVGAGEIGGLEQDLVDW